MIRFVFRLCLCVLTLCASVAYADQILLKDGTTYSGTFIRGSATTVEFRILDRTEVFNIDDIDRISFVTPDPPYVPAATPAMTPVAPATPSAAVLTPSEPPVKPQLKRRGNVDDTRRTARRADSLEPRQVTLPTGTLLTVRTSTAIDTDRNRVGDVFDATLEDDVMFGEQLVAPRGSTVKGKIAYAEQSGALAGQSQLILELTSLLAGGKSYTLRTSDYAQAGVSRGNRTAAAVGGTAALGAIIGAIAGGGRGAAIGAASGAAVGTGVQVITKGETLKIPAETLLEFQLQAPLTLDVL